MYYSKIISLLPVFFLLLLSCEKEDDPILPDDRNPFKDRVSFNGLMIDEKKYETPNAFLVFWPSSDSLSSDFDGYLTDGNFDKSSNDLRVKDFSIAVYFDFNSPSLTKLAAGKYSFISTNERKPGVFNSESQIRIYSNNKTEKLNITSGSVQIEENKGFILIEYELILNKVYEVKGQYTGVIDLKLPY
jgi:hypothetical protein